MNVREVLADMDACTVAMGRAADAGTHCFCSVRQTWLAPLYYLGLMPLVFISAVWFWSRPTARGTAAAAVILGAVLLVPWPIMALYGLGVRIPTFFQTMAVFWPQRVFFGPSLFRADSPGLVVPHEWSYILTIIFWAITSEIFGAFVRPVKSFGLLLMLATEGRTADDRQSRPGIGETDVIEQHREQYDRSHAVSSGEGPFLRLPAVR